MTTPPVVTITIPQPAAAELLHLIERNPEQIGPEHRVALLAVLRGAALRVLGKKG